MNTYNSGDILISAFSIFWLLFSLVPIVFSFGLLSVQLSNKKGNPDN
ncbi:MULTISPECIES: hypothetical protein [Lysinibacillus]|nr:MULTISPECIES: hypothetical protein [Lysinibacillus]UNT53497.1 hypothetical protein ICJ70_13160 [Lysinibacillus capsici]WDU81637.1 hypothetical protein PSR12_10835 [Lysinibacillus sp. G01H]WHP42911.1 hypothetical protein QIX46_07835 [Lysinibacillus boronitolerans]